jgi:hypothetical protein
MHPLREVASASFSLPPPRAGAATGSKGSSPAKEGAGQSAGSGPRPGRAAPAHPFRPAVERKARSQEWRGAGDTANDRPGQPV